MNYKKWLDKYIGDLTDKVFIVTGATGTLGKAAVKHLLTQNASVVMAVRNVNKAEKVKAELMRDFPRAFIKISRLCLDEFKSVDEFCAGIISEFSYVDGLINVAGVYHLPPEKTEDGFDKHYQVNYLAPLQLTDRLAPQLQNGRTVFVSSLSQLFARIDENDIESDKVKSRIKVYARSKRLLNTGVRKMREYYSDMSLNLAHPGVCSTELFTEKGGFSPKISRVSAFFTRIIFSSPEKCALSIVYGAANDVESGKWVHPWLFGVWGRPVVTKIIR